MDQHHDGMRFWLWLWLFLCASWSHAQSPLVYTLLAPAAPLVSGEPVEVTLVALNLTEVTQPLELPPTLALSLTDAEGTQVDVTAQVAPGEERAVAAGALARRTLVLHLPPALRGPVRIELAPPYRSPTLLNVAAAASSPASGPAADAAGSRLPAREPDAAALSDAQFLDHFGSHEPIYFVYGRETPAAKFQFSFKYRLFGLADDLIETLPALRGIHYGYTQRSLWDIEGPSGPFYDTSYVPELFYESAHYVGPPAGLVHWLGLQAGVRHESNGRGGLDSRSLNVVYARPTIAFGDLDDWRLILSPQFSTYITSLEDNPDLRDYRGYFELQLAFGRAQSWELALTSRMGEDFRNVGLQADLTIPVTVRRIGFSAYLMIQYFDGYAESLLQYQERTSALRAGISFVR